MEKQTSRLIILGILLFCASIAQFLGITLFGAVPNFVLVVIVMATLFLRDIWHELFLLSLASFLLKFSPIVERDIVAFFAIGLFIIVAERRLPWHAFVNGIFLTLCSTTLLYVLVDPSSVVSLTFAKELGYNVVLAYLLYHAFTSTPLFRRIG